MDGAWRDVKIKVLIADDNAFVREGMKIILESFPEFEVAAAVSDGREAVDYCERHEVDVALLDVRMPAMNGVEAARLLTERTKTKPLMLTTFDDDDIIVDAIRFGARGYLLKNNDPERIRDAIKTVYNGHHVLQDVALDKLKSMLSSGSPAGAGDGKSGQEESDGTRGGSEADGNVGGLDRSLFTERELEVMELIAKGLTNKEIAAKLFISEGTVANYITSVLDKTGLSHRTQIAIYYLTGKVG
jgi:Response regulator containing a CheY-like receiver domain and an HTH DNA-binding domain